LIFFTTNSKNIISTNPPINTHPNMNNPSPLLPQGSMFDQKNQRRTRVKIAVYFVLAVHGVGLMALLMQGCRKNNETGGDGTSTNAVPETAFNPTNPVVDTNISSVPVPSNPPTTTLADTNVQTLSAATDYKIVAGDNFWTIGKKYGVSAKAIADANPGLDPAKLKVNQTIHIPAAVKPTSSAGSSGSASADASAGDYKVKSGDTLSKIAAEHHTTVKALRAANNLKTDSIKVDQVLKIPAKSASADSTAAPGTPAPPHSR
jgi:LysM repeat protein